MDGSCSVSVAVFADLATSAEMSYIAGCDYGL